MGRCASGKHVWTDKQDAERCCNGWHRELRLRRLLPEDQKDGRPQLLRNFDIPAWQVWVKDKGGSDE